MCFTNCAITNVLKYRDTIATNPGKQRTNLQKQRAYRTTVVDKFLAMGL